MQSTLRLVLASALLLAPAAPGAEPPAPVREQTLGERAFTSASETFEFEAFLINTEFVAGDLVSADDVMDAILPYTGDAAGSRSGTRTASLCSLPTDSWSPTSPAVTRR